MILAYHQYVSYLLVLIGVLAIGGLLTLCFLKPNVGRFLARIFAVLAIGAGVAALLIWGLWESRITREGPESDIKMTAIFLGGGGGLLTSGVLALVLSFLGARKKLPSDTPD